MNTFLKKNMDAKKILESITQNNRIPTYILEQSTTINPRYQNRLWLSDGIKEFPNKISLDACEKILETLYDVYNWGGEEESDGRNPMVRNKSRLKYFAVLMNSWISGYQLNRIITSTLRYFEQKGFFYEHGQEIAFDKEDKSHLNKIINDLMFDIDNSLRFKIKNYILNYSLIYSERTSYASITKWVDYIEYGTTENTVIALQNIGIHRHLANFVIKYHNDCLSVNNNELIEFDAERLLLEIDKENFKQEHEELFEFCKNIKLS